MKECEDIVVLGDVHGEFGKLTMLVNNMQEVKLWLACGDFGYFPEYLARRERVRMEPSIPRMQGAELRFCDGNHDNHDDLQGLPDNQVYKGVYYMKRGSTYTLSDGRVVLFMGGAESTDKEDRLEKEAETGERWWFPQERITEQDLANLPDVPIDIVISHAAPQEFEVWRQGCDTTEPEPTRTALSAVLARYRESLSLWFFGHYHAKFQGEYGDVRYYGLNMAGRPDWWIKLPAQGD